MSAKSKSALIFGISGQDGGYLAELLLGQGIEVHGTSRGVREHMSCSFDLVTAPSKPVVHTIDPLNAASVRGIIETLKPDYIFNLAAQSSVGKSFDEPEATLQSNVTAPLHILEALRKLKSSAHFFNAGSGECFGDIGDVGATEKTPFSPQSPYGIAKAAAYFLVRNYRQAYGLRASNGILFNHESPRRPSYFVTQKIVRGVFDIIEGKSHALELGDLDVHRDWGWAPDYVDAMYRIVLQEAGDDFVISTGICHSLTEFIAACFAHMQLDWRQYVKSNSAMRRPTEIKFSYGNPDKAARVLQWKASVGFDQLIHHLMMAEMERRR